MTARKAIQRKKDMFLKEYGSCGIISQAARDSGIDRDWHYKWLASDEAYAKAFDAAGDEAADNLEAECRRRAVEGVEEPWHYVPAVYSEGGECVSEARILTKQRYSDTMLIFLTKGAKPGKFRERYDGAEGGNITVNLINLTQINHNGSNDPLPLRTEDIPASVPGGAGNGYKARSILVSSEGGEGQDGA